MPGTGEGSVDPSDARDVDGPPLGARHLVTDGGHPEGGESDGNSADDADRDGGGPADADPARSSPDPDPDPDPTRTRTETGTRYSWSEWGDPSVGVVEAVAAATGRDAAALPPLQDSIDGDGLDRLLRDRHDTEIRISFQYGGAKVTVDGDGGIVVRVDDE
jgi:hypothetical protein